MKAPPRRSDAPGAAQRWDPELYRRNAAFVPTLGEAVLELLAAQPGERILDLGCGDGALTRLIALRRAAVVGVDASADQVAAACALGLDARVMSGDRLTFAGEFDAVFSNAALHWMRAPDRVIDGVWRALRPGGRFVAECGGAGNVSAVRAELVAALERRGRDGRAADPWYFAGPDEYGARLAARGFIVRQIELIPRPTRLPGRLADWLDTFGESFLASLPPGDREPVKAEIEAALADRLRDANGLWTVDYVRLRFVAVKPAEEAA